MKSAITVSLVPEARGGPFVFWDDLPAACRMAKELGFDAIELFSPAPDAVEVSELRTLLDDNGLSLAAVGTGAGWVKHKLDAPDKTRRRVIGTLACFGSGGVGLGFWERLRLGFGPR